MRSVNLIAVLAILGMPSVAVAQGSPKSAFASLRWLEGRWLGSGGQYPAFYEEYRALNDSTIEQREIADSTFTKVNGRGLIALRGGRIVKLDEGNKETATISVVADTMTFARPSGRSYRWVRTGDGAWRAELGSVTYQMKRIAR